ncbi:MAG: 3'-5' exoribonuclease [Clostridia bacterium]|nr:3'-5' exoribonuclease [Clostridia bacterium]
MEILTQKINEKFKEKYSFLKLYEVVFNKETQVVEITFLYPEKIKEISEISKKEISDFILGELNLNSKILIKFKKSYLDENLISESILKFLKTNYSSVATFLQEDNIVVSKNELFINVNMELNKEIYDLYANKNLEESLKAFLENSFIAEFNVSLNLKEEEIDLEDILERQNKIAYDKTFLAPKVPRYRVNNPEVIFGQEIDPLPEFIKNIKFEKESCILAGKVENLEKNSYLAKKGKQAGQTKFYYSFVLNDTTSKIEVKYFSSKANEPKMDKLFADAEVLIVGDVREFNKKFTLYINSISYCKLPDVIEYKSEFKEGYECVLPKPYSVVKQENLFVKNKTLPKNVLDTEYVVFDTETTGLDPESCEIIEIGAVKIKNGIICEQFQTLINPKRPIPADATEINNITNEMVKDAPKIDVAIRDFYRWTRGATLVGYNLPFDLKFIQNAIKNEGLTFDNPGIDALVIAKNKLILKKYKLSEVVKRLEITLDNAHRALADAVATAEAFLILMRDY